MKWFSLFLLANVLDAAFTHISLANNMPVNETNPLVDYLINEFGLVGMWAFKVLVPCFMYLGVRWFFKKEESRNWIMKWPAIVLTITAAYSIILILWSINLHLFIS